ncbi:hypothetical protein SISSUDRAFT_987067 [Sistotremastrum suecicum HHB10207 ss-3]|uniref:VPS37 C-terminal domain-containing protein n=1 Tax=Sistotremastrum suecicum HHB10207 ss-3 TaxID=1314776 RepID=A0A166CW52_9AGAM|nr:hypothetical protein SISSUDRAFT_987067 [Sistotremastrum suecicum HHB10207 ss-3]
MTTPFQANFPELAHLTREDLEDLLADPAYFQSILHTLPRVQAMLQALAELGSANMAIAKNNLALQDELYQLRSETKAAYDEARYLESHFKGLSREQKEVYQRYDPSFLHTRLRHATTAQDDKSEALAASFIKSPPEANDIDAFIKEFKEARKVYHKRVIWGEKWAAGKVTWRDN